MFYWLLIMDLKLMFIELQMSAFVLFLHEAKSTFTVKKKKKKEKHEDILHISCR